MKKCIATCCTVVGIFGFCNIASIFAADMGPAEMTLQATVDPAKTPKPARFPHAEHQGRLQCSDCHHGKNDSGAQVAYSDGQKIEKCETCHNSSSGMPKNLETFKNAAHALCKNCHKENSNDLAKCSVCHVKQ